MNSGKEKKGTVGEDFAVEYLKKKGWEIIERNYRSGRNEIDIIGIEGDILVFVEVKWRKNETYGFPEEFVSSSQLERIGKAAEEYIYQHNWSKDIRFDIISILGENDDLQIDHLENVDF